MRGGGPGGRGYPSAGRAGASGGASPCQESLPPTGPERISSEFGFFGSAVASRGMFTGVRADA